MNRKKAYVSPQVIRVKLEPSQAVLSQCFVNITKLADSNSIGVCSDYHSGCKQADTNGNTDATS